MVLELKLVVLVLVAVLQPVVTPTGVLWQEHIR